MNLAYAAEKFNGVVHGIITLPETLTEHAKLEMTVSGTHTLTSDDFPPDLSQIFQTWRDELTRVSSIGEGSYQATINRLTKDEVYKHLRTFYDLYWRVNNSWRDAEPR